MTNGAVLPSAPSRTASLPEQRLQEHTRASQYQRSPRIPIHIQDTDTMGRIPLPSPALVDKIEEWKSTVPSLRSVEVDHKDDDASRKRTDSGVRGIASTEFKPFERGETVGFGRRPPTKATGPRQWRSYEGSSSLPQVKATRKQELEDHRLTLGSLTAGLGFDDIISRIDKVQFSDFSDDPDTAGRKFAEKVFGSVEWDRGGSPSSGGRVMGGGLDRTGPSTRQGRPLPRFDETGPSFDGNQDKKTLPPRKTLEGGGKPGFFGRVMPGLWKSPTQPTRPVESTGILQTSPSRSPKPLSFSIPESSSSNEKPVQSRGNTRSLHVPTSPTTTTVPTPLHTFPRTPVRTEAAAPAAEGQPPIFSQFARQTSTGSLSTGSTRSSLTPSVKYRFRDHLTPPSSPSPPRKSIDVLDRPPTRSKSQRSGRSSSHFSSRFRSPSRDRPRKSLEASSRKSSDMFFEFVDELYSRADMYGFVVFNDDKTRGDKLSEAAFLKTEKQRCRKWRGMAIEVSVHPAVMEADKRAREASGTPRMLSAEGASVPNKVAISPLFSFNKNGKFFSRLFKGVPQLWRGHVWYHLITGTSGLYDRMTPDQIGMAEADFIEKYHEFQTQPSAHDTDILLSVSKTFGNHIWFMQRQGPGQTALTRLLKAYSLYDPELGFVEGINCVCAMLLTVMEEERAFITLIHLFHTAPTAHYNLRLNYTTTPLTTAHDHLFRTHLPKLWTHFRQLGIETSDYLPQWYRTLFLSQCSMDPPIRRHRSDSIGPHKRWEGVLDFGTVCRIWDFVALGGSEGLSKISVGVLMGLESLLMSYGREAILHILRCEQVVTVDGERILKGVKRVWG
ncbi:uncharacterized protein SPPG_00883 [Spizellomyces punctatus DAOM BR117]|uniref:Rab-GAP TBC domain-containing protein n=1 Tax=Spizellomyces punctatus (strain DAOM BR117) TaxID=645134 RepID=A0A0L0HR30_SPIPD|nr:uncharacterized protein SPPG_00883 [Spizellomyces punctatus DAOM BR117]KND03395.1 hypothetical protein SPPG_00883 [Spizellomyces punctatus DAOM BR117]|eukprot:XP_016611434.1 hypothetical protein SPPG_00883 [Spizellomyces punctatus DAOM BR117]